MIAKAPSIPFFTLLLLISFASVNAVLFTPALPAIAHFFSITADAAQLTITWYLVGYALGQLFYGPIANRFGRKPALYVGILLQILSSLVCVFSGLIHVYALLVIGRFFLALGAGVGLKMTFTLVSESYPPKVASEKISYLLLAFAIAPGLSMALGGILTTHFGWMSCFYACAFYGFVLLFYVTRLHETKTIIDFDALQFRHLIDSYGAQFKNNQLVAGGLLMGCSTSIVYIFSAIAPFIAITLFGMSIANYGFASILPSLGIALGSLTSIVLVKSFSPQAILRVGLGIIVMGIILMSVAMWLHLSVLLALFLPMIVMYFSLSLVLSNASTLALGAVVDKSHGSAVMSFLNMGLTTVVVLSLGFFSIHEALLPGSFLVVSIFMFFMYKWLVRSTQINSP